MGEWINLKTESYKYITGVSDYVYPRHLYPYWFDHSDPNLFPSSNLQIQLEDLS